MAGVGKARFLIANPGEQPFNLFLFGSSDRQQRSAGMASVVAVEVAGVFDRRNAQLTDDALVGAAVSEFPLGWSAQILGSHGNGNVDHEICPHRLAFEVAHAS